MTIMGVQLEQPVRRKGRERARQSERVRQSNPRVHLLMSREVYGAEFEKNADAGSQIRAIHRNKI